MLLIALEDHVTGLAGNPELLAKQAHLFSFEEAVRKTKALLHDRTNLGDTLCLRSQGRVFPMGPVRSGTRYGIRTWGGRVTEG